MTERRSRPSDVFKYPPGVTTNCVIVANARHAKAHKTTPKGRRGIVVAPTSKRDFVRVKWDGCVSDDAVHRNFFDVVTGGSIA